MQEERKEISFFFTSEQSAVGFDALKKNPLTENSLSTFQTN
jgi:hypothetical protein